MQPASDSVYRTEATSFEFIEAVAMREPRRLAVVDGTRRYHYADVWDHAIRFTRALQALGVQRGHKVALSESGFFVHLVAVLACENLGACTASFLEAHDPDADVLFTLVDWVLSPQRPAGLPAGVRHIALDRAFISGIEAMDVRDPSPYPRLALRLAEPQRLTRTSGSTGKSKWMVFNRHTMEAWVMLGQYSRDYAATTVALLGAPFVVNAVLTLALALLRRGAVVASARASELGDLQPTHYYGLPLHLERFLAELPPGYVAPTPMSVGTIGGFVSGELRGRVARVLRGEVFNLYGANEVGGICPYFDVHGVGQLMPGTDVRLVDDEGAEVPLGEVGALGVRTATMVSQYVDNPDASAESFRDGWFFPGDRAVLLAPRELRLLGRDDDILVLGGLKLGAHEVEARLRAMPSVADAAIANLHKRIGATVFGVAVVAKPEADRAAIQAGLSDALDFGLAVPVELVFTDAIPRTANGKVDRRALQKRFD